MHRFKLNIYGIDMTLSIRNYKKSTSQNMHTAWCDTEICFYRHDCKLVEATGEIFLCSELEDLYKNLMLLLDNNLKESTVLSCIESYLDFVFCPKTIYDDKHLEMSVRFWDKGYPTENFLKLNMYTTECVRFAIFLQKVMGIKSTAFLDIVECGDSAQHLASTQESFIEDIEEKNTYRYVKVVYDQDSFREYSYLDENRIADYDDYVWVPVGNDNKQKVALVVDVQDYTADNVPYPVEKTKKILRLATEEEVAQIEEDW